MKCLVDIDNECLLLLRKFKWSITQVMDVYFTDPTKIQLEAGICLEPKPPKLKSGSIECQVCMENVDIRNVFSLECGHQVYSSSLSMLHLCCLQKKKKKKKGIRKSYYLKDGVRSKECVSLPCPAYKCNVVIREEYWQKFLAEQHPLIWERYQKFCRESFVECNKDFAFCPGKNCDMIYTSSAGIAKEVECKKCGLTFCWACKQEAHFPASCEVTRKWNTKNSDEAENLQWILAKTKKCPKCRVPIEKNQGCNHMTVIKYILSYGHRLCNEIELFTISQMCNKGVGGCGHEFCWLCKGDWKEHGSNTGGYYQCNIYEKQKAEGKQSEEEKGNEHAANELARYEFHWTRFDSHMKSSNHAKKELTRTHERMHELSQKFQWRLNEANFILEAVEEAVECWRVLSWTYPIAYYMDEKTNLQLFKEQQGTLENFCNGLQSKLDFDLDKLGDNKTRQEVIHYTRTSAQYRKNLVEYIETEISF
ncbi:hypothetical protein RFI_03643 [Reticulomyxa filosa]|uniref:RBR-type E3 ubiquitin transferase n=1 Tax=Reticulomyxa filosa TaxID=46433 RepID=X6P756_RETFI|nr:hypothetical protein RFI_03643 [Reticulomyxa filosa]|eukprot:ETO33467.1 hypothetical protein RFI_03643 [Reticulomyxa filosa]